MHEIGKRPVVSECVTRHVQGLDLDRSGRDDAMLHCDSVAKAQKSEMYKGGEREMWLV